MTPSVVLADETILAAFDDPASAGTWKSVNDGVMGGVSEGGFERTDAGTLVFSGDLSLENNGGFASIRTEPQAWNLSGFSGVVVKARGDGRTYWFEVRKDRQRSATSYRAYLPTTDGEWVETFVPFEDFKLQSYGRPVDAGPIDPSTISSIGFLLADKNPGPFELEIAYVKAVTGNGDTESDHGGNTIVDVASAAGMFETLLAAAVAADLAGVLAGDGPFTVLAPSDDAFAKLPDGTVEDLLKPANKQRLVDVLKYHVLAGRVSLAQALAMREGDTLQGEPITAAFEDGRVKIGPATLIAADIPASNGIIHVIDQVLLPPEADRAPLAPASLIELAIDRGVPLFNQGHAGACADVYELACEALRTMPSVCEHSTEELELALSKIAGNPSASERAWILRHALDRVYHRLATDA
jgi:uncharacterized surface protein with fasciclin (FAS1) repeats